MKLFILALLLTPALASAKSFPKPTNNFSVSVPASEIELREEVDAVPGTDRTSIEFGLSSWSPSDFTRKTYTGKVSAFTSATPGLLLNLRIPFANYSNGATISSKLGLSYKGLERTGAPPSNVTSQVTQKLDLYQLRAGAEYAGPVFAGRILQPYVGLALLPTMALAGKSELEGTVSSLGLPLEVSGGILARPRVLRDFWGFSNGAIGLGGQYVFGTVDESELNGFGIQGFFQVSL